MYNTVYVDCRTYMLYTYIRVQYMYVYHVYILYILKVNEDQYRLTNKCSPCTLSLFTLIWPHARITSAWFAPDTRFFVAKMPNELRKKKVNGETMCFALTNLEIWVHFALREGYQRNVWCSEHPSSIFAKELGVEWIITYVRYVVYQRGHCSDKLVLGKCRSRNYIHFFYIAWFQSKRVLIKKIANLICCRCVCITLSINACKRARNREKFFILQKNKNSNREKC